MYKLVRILNTSNVSVKDDGEVLEKFWTKIDNNSYLNMKAAM